MPLGFNKVRAFLVPLKEKLNGFVVKHNTGIES